MSTKPEMIHELQVRLGCETTKAQAEKAFEWLDEKFDVLRRVDRMCPTKFFYNEVSADDWTMMFEIIDGD